MKNSFQRVYAVQEVGLRGVRPSLFMWCSSAAKRLEAAREAETGGVLFASMYVVMNGLFLLRMACVEQCSGATKMLAILLTVKPSKIVRFKNTGVLPVIREVSGVFRKCISYVFTWQLHVQALAAAFHMTHVI